MPTHLRFRTKPAWRYALPAATVVVAMTAGLVPAQAATAVPPTDDVDYPTAPGPGRLDDPQALILAQEVDQAFRYSLTIAVSDPDRVFPADSVEAVLQAGAATLPADQQERTRRTAQAMLADPAARTAEFGRHGRTDPARYSFDAALSQPLPVDWAALRRSLEAEAAVVEAESAVTTREAMDIAAREGIDPTAASSLVKDVRMVLTSVKAINIDDIVGDDEFVMGGVAVNHKGVTKKVDKFTVDKDFAQGETVVFSPPRTFSYASVANNDPSAPMVFCNVLMGADEDFGGGFADALATAWEKVKGKVLAVVEAYIGTALSVYLGKVLAGLIGKLIGWMLGKLFTLLLKLIKDDLLPPVQACAHLPHRRAYMYDNGKLAGWDNHQSEVRSLWTSSGYAMYRYNFRWVVGT